MSEKQITDKYGFKISNNLDHLSVAAFADDLVVIGQNMHAARELVMMTKYLLQQIGLQLNIAKSVSINIEHGKLQDKELLLYSGYAIRGITKEEKIKYLGVSFNDEIIFDR